MRETGNGRFDIQMLPLNKKLPGILIELKAEKNCTEEQLDELAENALKQINDRQYHVEMSAQDVKEILQYGIAFSGKSASIKAEVRRL
ncbi:MAG: PD-(D/E)XK nuclease domain-containing protein [Lachnospiraceae bacterium]|nr:PD-(D/E)XK nuclease domain-containing protein [Lachnospiraceae bacterium]MBR3761321.1 PD-(D/E)XK nuclease domain-containing protein [Lachnospiraceae bacterium]